MVAAIGKSRFDVGLTDCPFTQVEVAANQNHLIGVFDLLMFIKALMEHTVLCHVQNADILILPAEL